MESLRLSPVHTLGIPSSKLYNRTQFPKLISFNTTLSSNKKDGKSFKLFTSLPTSTPFVSDITEIETDQTDPDGKFDWYSQWYPVMPVCDLDKRVPHGKRVIGMDIVVWWDRNESAWKVFDDSCPHRLAPLSEGRIDKLGRLQCVYHGWCFNGGGDCKLIPQAPPDGPPVHTFKKACATVYPSTVQNDIVWFWPNADPQYKDILSEKKPPYIPEIDDPSYTRIMANRDLPYSYEVLIENLMDPAHVPYAHYGIMRPQKTKNKVDREGGVPIDLVVNSLEPSGFSANRDPGVNKFYAPCVYVSTFPLGRNRANGGASYEETKPKPGIEKRLAMVFICIPVSPGRSRIIWTFPRNFAVWLDKIVPRWLFHVGQNLILDSDLYLLHAEERKIMEAGGSEKWQKVCFVPTKSDTFVITFRKWLNKYAGGQVDWRGKFSGALPPTPPREQLFDRYWSHVVNCSSCRFAYKGLNVLQIVLQVLSFSLLGIVAATKQTIPSMAIKTAMVSVAILCFVGSKWLAHYIRKVFHFHDYSHALR